MPQSESSAKTVFRACVVNAVRGGDALMAQLIELTRTALSEQESSCREPQQRNLVGDALRLLQQHEAELVKAYPMALLEVFAQGPAVPTHAPAVSGHASLTGMDFGELSLVDDAQVQAQVDLSRAQQQAQHTTDAVLAELNALVSAAQGLHRVQPERNPLRPENYLRALQQTVAQTGVPAAIGEVWMPPMRDFLGHQLVAVYQSAVQDLHSHGVEPVGYGLAPALSGRSSSGRSADPIHSHYAALEPRFSSTDWGDTPEISVPTQEELLTAEILRQLLSGGGNLYEAPPSVYASPIAVPAGPTAWAAPDPAVQATQVVQRMVQNIAQDARLPGPVQRAVQALEPAIGQLARIDPSFFSDEQHPARRLLDELTQRSMAFSSENTPGFGRFMQLVHQAVAHLTGQTITSAAPFASVLKALETAWQVQQQHEKALQQHQQLQARTVAQTDQRQQLAQRVAANIRALPEVGQVPMEVMDFAAGPWAEVVAQAQIANPQGTDDDPGGYLALVPWLFWSVQTGMAHADSQRVAQNFPGLLETLQKGLRQINHPPAQINAVVDLLQGLHRQALAAAQAPVASANSVPTIPVLDQRPTANAVADAGIDIVLEDAGDVDFLLDSAPPLKPASGQAAGTAPVPVVAEQHFGVGVWVELVSSHKVVRTQLTWASPQGTLFLFTAPDGSTQSMTLRTRDRLLAEGNLRMLPPP
ncbi:MAG: DUF1631 domain-containing protein [Burkholderiaceae bacterium]|nr:DUF1631 domain-containing protein [Burkholderiaceae bacterium]